jgi:hypothetical protein
MDQKELEKKVENDWNGPVYRHPYFLYVWITFGLFIFLMVMGYLALKNDWVPTR